jgi:hypothetical protein
MSRRNTRLLPPLGATLALSLLVACSDRAADPSPEPPAAEPAILLSAPVPQSLLDEGATSATNVFVSASPGAFPRGARATLAVRRAGLAVGTLLAAGGFDAVPLRAVAGDEIEVVVTDSAGGSRVATGTVRAPARPKVVRTSPGPARSDVPLNVIMQVVFSAPMDAASVSAALELYRGGTPVPGTVTLADDDGTTASFVPAAPLEPSTDYRLVLAASARDVLGQALDTSVVLPFTTGTSASAPSIYLVAIDREVARLELGTAVDVGAVVCAQYTVPCIQVNVEVSWSSTSPGVAAVAALGAAAGPGLARISAVSPGVARVVAAAGGLSDTMEVYVASPAPQGSLAANELVFSATDPLGNHDFVTMNLFAVRADGTGLTQLTHAVSRSYTQPSVARDGRVVFLEDGARLSVRELDGTVHPLFPVGSFGLDLPNCPAWSPDMRYVAYQNSADPSFPGRQGIRVISADGSGTIVAEINAPATCPSWSPDGTRLSYGLSDWDGLRLAVADVTRFPEVHAQVGPLREGRANFGQWSPDGDGLATSVTVGAEGWGTEGWIERTPADGTPGARIAWLSTTGDLYGPTRPDWSSDGRLVAYGHEDGTMIVVDAKTGGNGWWERGLPVSGFDPAFVPSGVSFTR